MKPRVILVECVQRLFTFGDLRQNAGSGCGPDKDTRVLIGLIQVILNGRDQIGHAVERSAPDSFIRQVAEPSFHQIEPGAGRGRKNADKSADAGAARIARGDACACRSC